MKYYTKGLVAQLAIALFFLATPSFLFSQSLMTRLGGAQTKFNITSDHATLLNNSSQYIVRRAVNEWETLGDGIGAYGHEAFHLEFLATDDMIEYPVATKKDQKFLFRFFDESDELLTKIYFPLKHVTSLTLNHNRLIYSINLKSIPLVLLNETQRIDIVFMKKGS